MRTWQSLLTGDEAAIARQMALDIADRTPSTRAPDKTEPTWPLLDGYLAKVFQSDQHFERALAQLQLQLSNLPTHPGLYGGVAGLGWTTAHLGRLLSEGLESSPEDLCEALDERLLAWVEQGEIPGYDLISGLTGIAVYALERAEAASAERLLRSVVERLLVEAEVDGEGARWLTPVELLPPHQREVAPTGYYNLGVAHGVPAVSVVLARTISAGIGGSDVENLLDGVLHWLPKQRSVDGEGARFPNWVTSPGGLHSGWAREAWCYGGLGLSVAMLAAARAVNHQPWQAQALEFARQEASRSIGTGGVVDACLCHGSGGNAHLYNRLFQTTGEELFRDAALKWLRTTMRAYRPKPGSAGFLFNRPHPTTGTASMVEEHGFLGGARGVALALLAASSDLEPNWDRVLLADLGSQREK